MAILLVTHDWGVVVLPSRAPSCTPVRSLNKAWSTICSRGHSIPMPPWLRGAILTPQLKGTPLTVIVGDVLSQRSGRKVVVSPPTARSRSPPSPWSIELKEHDGSVRCIRVDIL